MKRTSILLLLLFGLSSSALASQPRAPSRSQHRVVAGETLIGIARANGVTVAELQGVNNLKGSLIRPGQRLLLPTVRAAKSAAHGRTATATPRQQKVKESAAPPTCYLPLDGLPATGSDLTPVAMSFLATPYHFGANGWEATDCSGFTQQVYRLLGFELPRTAREQFRSGAVVPPGEWQRGDLLFFRTYARYPSHVAIYLGDGKMIHASRSQRKVVISEADRPYFRKRLLGARRIACFDPGESNRDPLIVPSAATGGDGLLEADLAPVPAAIPQSPAPSPVPVPTEVVAASSVTLSAVPATGTSRPN